jgi:hypothetical protein
MQISPGKVQVSRRVIFLNDHRLEPDFIEIIRSFFHGVRLTSQAGDGFERTSLPLSFHHNLIFRDLLMVKSLFQSQSMPSWIVILWFLAVLLRNSSRITLESQSILRDGITKPSNHLIGRVLEFLSCDDEAEQNIKKLKEVIWEEGRRPVPARKAGIVICEHKTSTCPPFQDSE